LDARELPEAVASAEKSKSGEQDRCKLGEDYWGYGRFADAEAAARRAMAKGGLKDPGEGNLLLGATLVAQGKYDEAIQTFGQVNGITGEDEGRPSVVALCARKAKEGAGIAAHRIAARTLTAQ
jgi:tetratricopeptide (TPR) repeat protein